MNEEQLKKLIQKSTTETSEDFVNQLMTAIEAQEKVKKARVLQSFKIVLLACTVLIAGLTFLLFKFLGIEFGTFRTFTHIPRTPIFIVVLLVLLYYVNRVIRLRGRVG